MHRLKPCLCVFFVMGLGACSSRDVGSSAAASTLAPTPSGLSIRGLDGSLLLGQSVSLTATVTLPGGTKIADSGVVWRSSAPNVATVSETGVVTAVGLGVARISAKVLDLEGGVTVSVPWHISGRVHETRPTASSAVEGVQVRDAVVGTVLATTDRSGEFAFNVDNAYPWLVFDRAGYYAVSEALTLRAFESGELRLDVALLPLARQIRDVFTHDSREPAVTVATFPVPVQHDGVIRAQGWACSDYCSPSAAVELCGQVLDAARRVIFQVHGSYDFPPFGFAPIVEVSGVQTYLVQVYGCENDSFAPRPDRKITTWNLEISRPQ